MASDLNQANPEVNAAMIANPVATNRSASVTTAADRDNPTRRESAGRGAAPVLVSRR
jgi:hypothetical protein